MPAIWKLTLAPEDVKVTGCQGRRLDLKNHRDERYKPFLLLESQCTNTVTCADHRLCTTCDGRLERYTASNDEPSQIKSSWAGLITEPPLPFLHVLGTRWFNENAELRDGPPSATKAAAKVAVAAAKAAAKARSIVQVAAARAQMTAAAAVSAAVDAAGTPTTIDGVLYMVKDGNVYDYDEMTARPGMFVGRLDAEGAIDRFARSPCLSVATSPVSAPALKLPRGLCADLETTVAAQDRQFLAGAAVSLGLPAAAAAEPAAEPAEDLVADMMRLAQTAAAALKIRAPALRFEFIAGFLKLCSDPRFNA